MRRAFAVRFAITLLLFFGMIIRLSREKNDILNEETSINDTYRELLGAKSKSPSYNSYDNCLLSIVLF